MANGLKDAYTVLYVDGNSFSLVAGHLKDDRVHISAVEHLEVDRLLEVSKRLRHQVFMDVDLYYYKGADQIGKFLQDNLEKKGFQNPVILAVAPDRFSIFDEKDETLGNTLGMRWRSLFKAQVPRNPYSYPLSFLFQTYQASTGSYTRFGVGPFSHLAQAAEILKKKSIPFEGFIPVARATTQVSRLLRDAQPGRDIILLDVGKLRSIYTTSLQSGDVHHYTIPVGLARDDNHYFESFTPTFAQLEQLVSTQGQLLLPPEVTPSPLFNARASTPIVDCTRFANQLALSALRVTKVQQNLGKSSSPCSIFLTGVASRLPGLIEYLRKRTKAEIAHFDEVVLDKIVPGEGISPEDLSNNLAGVGALCEVFRPTNRSLGILGYNVNQPEMNLESDTLGLENLKERLLYVMERPKT